MDDTFVTSPHDLVLLQPLPQNLYQIHYGDREERYTPFLHVLVTRNPQSHTTRTTVHRKPTYTDRYIHYRSYHPPSTKNGIIRTLLHRSKTICLDPESQNNEVSHLTSVFQQNWYPFHFIHEALRQRSNPEQPEPRATISIPYVKGISEKIKRICAKDRIHVYFNSSRTTGSLLSRVRSCTDPNDTTGVVYCIPCQDCDMWMKLAALLLKPDCQSTGGTAEMEKLRDQAWCSIPLRKTTGLTGKAALSKEKKLVQKKSEGGSPHPQRSYLQSRSRTWHQPDMEQRHS